MEYIRLFRPVRAHEPRVLRGTTRNDPRDTPPTDRSRPSPKSWNRKTVKHVDFVDQVGAVPSNVGQPGREYTDASKLRIGRKSRISLYPVVPTNGDLEKPPSRRFFSSPRPNAIWAWRTFSTACVAENDGASLPYEHLEKLRGAQNFGTLARSPLGSIYCTDKI